MGFIVKTVTPDSIAEEVGICVGDEVVDFNNQPFEDIIDYVFFASKTKLSIGYIDKNGEAVKAKIKKTADEPIGVEFEQTLLGHPRACGNRCIFCFVDQLPKDMRRSLYLKDEDWRYSFVYGNYVTLSRISNKDLKRIRKRKISHLFVSVHAVNEDLRKMLLGNASARAIKPLMRRLARYGVEMHTQIVLMSGINDGAYLEETYRFLSGLYPRVKSVSVIPVGLTGHRKGLYPLKDISKQEAKTVINTVETWQQSCRKKLGVGLIYASDEMYIKAGVPIPDAESYDDFPQEENGVGLIAKFKQEFETALSMVDKGSPRFKSCAVLTGVSAFPYLSGYIQTIHEKFGADIDCVKIENRFFGGGVDVTGLLNGQDIINQLKTIKKYDAVLLPDALLRDGEDVLLDDISIRELETQLNMKIVISPTLGDEFLYALVKEEDK